MNRAKTGRVKVLMAHFLLLNYQDKPWGGVTKIIPPDGEEKKKLITCPMLRGLRYFYLFSPTGETFYFIQPPSSEVKGCMLRKERTERLQCF